MDRLRNEHLGSLSRPGMSRKNKLLLQVLSSLFPLVQMHAFVLYVDHQWKKPLKVCQQMSCDLLLDRRGRHAIVDVMLYALTVTEIIEPIFLPLNHSLLQDGCNTCSSTGTSVKATAGFGLLPHLPAGLLDCCLLCLSHCGLVSDSTCMYMDVVFLLS